MFEEIWIAPGEYWREMTLALGLFLLPALVAIFDPATLEDAP